MADTQTQTMSDVTVTHTKHSVPKDQNVHDLVHLLAGRETGELLLEERLLAEKYGEE